MDKNIVLACAQYKNPVLMDLRQCKSGLIFFYLCQYYKFGCLLRTEPLPLISAEKKLKQPVLRYKMLIIL